MIHKIFNIFLFLPSVTFNLLKAEIFPWAILKYCFMRQRFSVGEVILISTILLGSIIGIVTYSPFAVISSAASYLNPLLAFILVLKSSPYFTNKIVSINNKMFCFLIFLGALQFSGLLSVLNPIFELLMPRGSFETLGSGRGVSLLSSEPSRGSQELVFMYAVLVCNGQYRGTRFKGTLLQDLFFIAFIALVCRSGTGMAFALLFFCVRRPLVFFPVAAIFGMFLINELSEIRAAGLMLNLLSQQSFFDFARELILQSGFRLISVVSAYVYAINNFFGHGIGSWTDQAVTSYLMAGFSVSDTNYFHYNHNSEFVNLKPTAFMALVALEFGLIGMLIVSSYIFMRIRSIIKTNLAITSIFLMSIFCVGSVGNPIPWICMALVINLVKQKNIYEMKKLG